MSNRVFTFAHISDPHLPLPPAVRARKLINKRVLGYLSWHRKRKHQHKPAVLDALIRDMRTQNPDHICVTGDLVNIGLPPEFAASRDWLENLAPAEQISVIPGNHDAYVREGAKLIAKSWDTWMGNGFPYIHKRGPVAFIGLNSGIPTAPFMATGRIDRQQLQALEDTLAAMAGESLFRVVMLHHPARPGIEKPRKALTNAAALCAVLEKYGAGLVLHGHMHRPVRYDIGHIPVFGAGSASLMKGTIENSAHYHIFRLDKDRLYAVHRRYDPASGTFTETGAETLTEHLTSAHRA